jgi:hypothetical protein
MMRNNADDYLLTPDTAPMGIVALATLIGACGLAIVVVLAVSKGLERLGKAEGQIAELRKIEAQYQPCALPSKSGDAMVITVQIREQKLVTTCQQLKDWREPMRSLK